MADDDPSIRQLLRDCLTGDGFRCMVVADGLQLLRALGLVRPAAIILDARMPNLDGMGVLTRLREDAALRAIPVVAISAQADAAVLLDAGCREFIAKPFDLMELIGALNACLS